MSSYEFLTGGFTYALIGAGIGGLWGVLNVARSRWNASSPSSVSPVQEYAQHPNIALDPVVVEALSRFKTYKDIIPREFSTIVDNLDRLIGLQVSINQGKIESYYSFRATTYVTHIQTALNAAKSKVRNVSVPHWDVDESSIQQIADDYLYNITQEVNEYMLSNRPR